MQLRVGTATHVGRVRDHQEDAGLAEGRVYVVADGMGGHAAGEVASRLVVETMGELSGRDELSRDDVVDQLGRANDRILESAEAHPEQSGMGTTATGIALVTSGGTDKWAIFNIGDSRVYRYLDGRLHLVTIDHSEVQEMVDAGVITPEQALNHPLRNVVTRSLGLPGAPGVDVWVAPQQPGERFVICSDGLSNEVSAAGIGEILELHGDAQEAADRLVEAALDAGGRDNVTVIVVDVAGDDADDHTEDAEPRPAPGARTGESDSD